MLGKRSAKRPLQDYSGVKKKVKTSPNRRDMAKNIQIYRKKVFMLESKLMKKSAK